MAKKFESTVLILAASGLIGSQVVKAEESSWTDDFTECNMYRILDWQCPEERGIDAKRFEMIPATQRTNNVAGFALDVTPWSTKTQFWLKMVAYTPKMPDFSVFEMYASVLDKWDTSRPLYDTVKCSTEYWGTAQENPVGGFWVDDYRSSEIFYDLATIGNN